MARAKCIHGDADRNASGNCRSCRRARDAAKHRPETQPIVEDTTASRRILATDAEKIRRETQPRLTNRDAVLAGAQPVLASSARTSRSLGGGAGQTIEGGGSPRAWVICPCASCEAGRMRFADGTERRQDGERDLLHPVHYRRYAEITVERPVIDAEGAEHLTEVIAYPRRWVPLQEAPQNGHARRPSERPAA